MQLLQSTNHLRQLTDAVNEAIAEEFDLFGFPDAVPTLTPGIVRVACQVFTQCQTEATDNDAMSDPIKRILRVDDLVKRKPTDDATITVTDDDGRRGHRRFSAVTPAGRAFTINGAPDMDAETRSALGELMDRAYEHFEATKGAPVPDDDTPDPPPSKIREAMQRHIESHMDGTSSPEPTPLSDTESFELAEENAPAAEESKPTDDEAPATTPARAPVIPKIPPVQIVPARLVNEPSLRPAPASPSHAAEMAQKRRELKERAFAFLRQIAIDGVMPSVAEFDERKPADMLDGKNLMNSLGYMSWQDVAQDADLKWSGKGRVQVHAKRGRPRKS